MVEEGSEAQCLPPAYTVPTAGVHPPLKQVWFLLYTSLSVMPVFSGHFTLFRGTLL